MPKPYDATTKWLIDLHPQDWLGLLGFPSTEAVEPIEVELLDTDLAAITASSDRVLKVFQPWEMLHHIEMESGHHGSEKPHDLLNYSVLLTRKYNLPVATTVILLRREADSPALTGALAYSHTGGAAYLRFEYNVVRIWEIPVETFLTGGLGTLPLAPLSRIGTNQLPDVVHRMQQRFDAEAGLETRELWTATKILMGLRYSRELADNLLKGVRDMRESVTYQAILQEGEARGLVEGEARGLVEGEARGLVEGEARGLVEGERQMLLRVGARRLGPASPNIEARIASIGSPERLGELGDKLFAVESWDELLAD